MIKEYTAEENAAWLAAQPKKMVWVKAIIKTKDGRILLLKPDYKKTWQMPGGAVDANESPEEGLSREVFEETGIRISKDDFNLKGSAYRRDQDGLVLVYEYKGMINLDQEIKMQNDEIEDYGFFEASESINKIPKYYEEFLKSYAN